MSIIDNNLPIILFREVQFMVNNSYQSCLPSHDLLSNNGSGGYMGPQWRKGRTIVQKMVRMT